jgi:hypothetical protein
MSDICNSFGNIGHKLYEPALSLMDHLLDNTAGKGAIITYSFERLKIEMDTVQGLKGKQLGGGSFILNGKIRISAEIHKVGKSVEMISDKSRSSPKKSFKVSTNRINEQEPTLKDYRSDQNIGT